MVGIGYKEEPSPGTYMILSTPDLYIVSKLAHLLRQHNLDHGEYQKSTDMSRPLRNN